MKIQNLLFSFALFPMAAVAQDNRPNILFFLVDDMGWEDTSVPFSGQSTELNKIYQTPNMERLANMGVMFTRAYAQPISSPSRVSLMTGANSARHRVTNWTLEKDKGTDGPHDELMFPDWNYNGLSPEKNIPSTFYAKCLPQILSDNGYTTMMVGKAHFGAIDTPAEDPLAIGFQYNIAGHAAGGLGSYLGEDCYGNDPSGKPTVWGVPDLEKYWGSDVFATEALTLEAMSLLDVALEKDKPFFLYMSHYAVHVPFAADKRFYDKYLAAGLDENEAKYASMVEGMDKSLGDLMDYLEEKGVADRTIVIFMSDNGGYTISRPGKNAPLDEGKGSLKEGGIREPMMIYWPGVTQGGTQNDTPVLIEDFFPTLLDMAGIDRYEVPQKVDGKSMVPLLQNRTYAGRPLVFHFPNVWGERVGTIGAPQSAIIDGKWKLIYYYENERSVLYDLEHDLSEQHDLSADPAYSGKLKDLQQKLTQYLKDRKATLPYRKSDGEHVAYPDGSVDL